MVVLVQTQVQVWASAYPVLVVLAAAVVVQTSTTLAVLRFWQRLVAQTLAVAAVVVMETAQIQKAPWAAQAALALLWCGTLSCVSAWLLQAALLRHTPLVASSIKPTRLHQARTSAW